jgi:hypothetical protein
MLKKQRRYEKMYRDVQRWQREGNRNATIEATKQVVLRDYLDSLALKQSARLLLLCRL